MCLMSNDLRSARLLRAAADRYYHRQNGSPSLAERMDKIEKILTERLVKKPGPGQ